MRSSIPISLISAFGLTTILLMYQEQVELKHLVKVQKQEIKDLEIEHEKVLEKKNQMLSQFLGAYKVKMSSLISLSVPTSYIREVMISRDLFFGKGIYVGSWIHTSIGIFRVRGFLDNGENLIRVLGSHKGQERHTYQDTVSWIL